MIVTTIRQTPGIIHLKTLGESSVYLSLAKLKLLVRYRHLQYTQYTLRVALLICTAVCSGVDIYLSM